MKARLALGLAAAVAAMAVGVYFLADPRNFVVIDPRGSATSGSMFGVTIGMPMGEGDARMKALPGVTKAAVNVKQDGICFIEPDQQLSIFDDHSWRHGSVCLISKNDRVEKIVWDYESGVAALQ